jgi:hypothetical protein
MGAEHRLPEHVEHLVLGIVLVHRDLLQDHRPLGVGVPERGPPHHVRHHLHRAWEVAVQNARVHRGGLLAGAGVELRAHRVEDLVDLERGEALRAAEQQVLEQVRKPGLLVGLEHRAAAHPEPDRHRADGRHVLGDDPQPGVELSQQVVGHQAVCL